MLLGLTLGGVLLAHAGLQIARAFPPEVRASAVDAVKKRPRLAAVTAAVTAWTLVYALYSLAFPSGAAFFGAPADTTEAIASSETAADDGPAPIADNRELLPPGIGGELALPPEATATLIPDTTPTTTTTTAPPADGTPAPPSPPPEPEPEPEPCPAEAVANALGPQAVDILCPGSSP